MGPTFTGNVTTPSLTVNNDSTLKGNLHGIGTDKVIRARKPKRINLTLLGDVVFDSSLNAPSGAILGNTVLNGSVTHSTKAVVGLSDVDDTTDLAKELRTKRSILIPFSHF